MGLAHDISHCDLYVRKLAVETPLGGLKSKQLEINAFTHLTHVVVQGFWLIHQAAIACPFNS